MSQGKKIQKKKSATGQIRIIAGRHRGRKLPVIMAEGLRPTTDRIKETVFNWLMPYMPGSRCLDCFAGAGSLGFEAQSRGAEQVTLIELDKQAAKQLSSNKSLLKADNVSIEQSDTLLYLQKNNAQPFDIIFIDPPFRKGFIKKTTSLLSQGWLAEEALIYLEMESEVSCADLPDNWTLLKEKVAGQVAYRLYQVG
jgi:16S rRNA (guanine966-N2)-methyltransferase